MRLMRRCNRACNLGGWQKAGTAKPAAGCMWRWIPLGVHARQAMWLLIMSAACCCLLQQPHQVAQAAVGNQTSVPWLLLAPLHTRSPEARGSYS